LLSVVLLLIDSILKITKITRVTRVTRRIDSTAVRLNNYKAIAELTISTIDILLLASAVSITY